MNFFVYLVQKGAFEAYWHVRINHIYHEANYAADRMANLATSFLLGLHMFMIPLEGVKPLQGVACPRLVSS